MLYNKFIMQFDTQNHSLPLMSVTDLKKVYSYDPNSGAIFKKGYGTILSSSKTIKIQLKPIPDAREYHLQFRYVSKCKLAFALHYGRWSWFEVLPLDGDYTNTKLSNLKEQVPRVLVPRTKLPDNVRRIDDLDKFMTSRHRPRRSKHGDIEEL